jgi:hypothetical protein
VQHLGRQVGGGLSQERPSLSSNTLALACCCAESVYKQGLGVPLLANPGNGKDEEVVAHLRQPRQTETLIYMFMLLSLLWT